MSLVSLRGVTFTWSGPALLENVDLEIGRGERIGLLGRNGMGKSTLMKIIVGEVPPDDGLVRIAEGVRIGRLVQEVPAGTHQTVAGVILQGYPADARAWLVMRGLRSRDAEIRAVCERLRSEG